MNTDEAKRTYEVVIEVLNTTPGASFPFILKDGSSGLGKTQSVFTLAESIKAAQLSSSSSSSSSLSSSSSSLSSSWSSSSSPSSSSLSPRSLLYFLLQYPDNPQSVYRPFQNQSVFLGEMLRLDLGETSSTDVMRSMNWLKSALTSSFYTLGFISQLLEAGASCDLTQQVCITIDLTIKPMSVSDFKLKHRGVVVCLDEVPYLQREKSLEPVLRLVRNLLRAAECCTVLLGTDSTVSNMIAGGGSRESLDTPQPWAYIITSYPKATEATIDLRFPHVL